MKLKRLICHLNNSNGRHYSKLNHDSVKDVSRRKLLDDYSSDSNHGIDAETPAMGETANFCERIQLGIVTKKEGEVKKQQQHWQQQRRQQQQLQQQDFATHGENDSIDFNETDFIGFQNHCFPEKHKVEGFNDSSEHGQGMNTLASDDGTLSTNTNTNTENSFEDLFERPNAFLVQENSDYGKRNVKTTGTVSTSKYCDEDYYYLSSDDDGDDHGENDNKKVKQATDEHKLMSKDSCFYNQSSKKPIRNRSVHWQDVNNTTQVVTSRSEEDRNNDGREETNDESALLVRTFEDQSDVVNCVLSVDDDKFLSESYDGSINLWSVSGEILQRYGHGSLVDRHMNRIRCIAIIDQDKFISGSYDKSIKLWDMKSGKCVRTYQGHCLGIMALTVLNKHLFLSASADDSIKLWDINNHDCLCTYRGHENTINSIVAVTNETFLTASFDTTIKLWHCSDTVPIHTFVGHRKSVNEVAVIRRKKKKSRKFLSVSDDKTIKLWRIKTGECLFTYIGHTSWVQSIAVVKSYRKKKKAESVDDRSNYAATYSGGSFITGSDDRSIRLWNMSTGVCERTILNAHFSDVNQISVVNKDNFLSASKDCTIKLWRLK